MTKLYKELRAAVSINGWMTLYVDPQSWTFHIYLGIQSMDAEELGKMFEEHLVESKNFISDVTRTDKLSEADIRNRSAGGRKWLTRQLKKCHVGVCQKNTGLTLENPNGPIFVFVPGFELDDIRSVTVLAHELIHAANCFSQKLHIDDHNDEFVANIHTTLMERILKIEAETDWNKEIKK